MLYKGAGILPCFPWLGKTYVLLGLRRVGWDHDTWSIPGGGMEKKDQGSFWNTAVRETLEEYYYLFKFRKVQPFRLHEMSVSPVFEWKTYACWVDFQPIPKLPLSWEFKAFGWFDIKELPENLHPLLKKSMEFFFPQP